MQQALSLEEAGNKLSVTAFERNSIVVVVIDNHLRSPGRLSILTLVAFYLFFGIITYLMSQVDATLKMDRLVHDNWVRFNQSTPASDLVIVGIDDHSLEKHGRWPWSRLDQAKIVDNLADAGAKIILMDVLYSESDRKNPADDARLAFSIERAESVILPIHTEGRGQFLSCEKLPIASVLMAAKNLGHIYLPIDSDSIVRRAHLRAGCKTPHWSMLSLIALESLGEAPDELPGERVDHLDPATSWVGDYEVLIPFHGPKNTFRTISAYDVLSGDFDPDVINGSVIFFGLTATGLGDSVPTPILGEDQPLPGVEVHANIYSALSQGTLIGQAGVWITYLLVAISIAALLAIYSLSRPRWGLLATIVLAFLPIALSFLLYRYAGLWFAPLTAAIPVLLAFPLWSWHRLEFASRFISAETDKLAIYEDDLGVSAGLPLESLFRNAESHLGLKRWFLYLDRKVESGTDSSAVESAAEIEKIVNQSWTKRGELMVKRFKSKEPFIAGFGFNDQTLNQQFSEFLDNASRVKSRTMTPGSGGTIESLQTNADRLSLQNQNMLQLKILNDNVFNGSPAGLIVWNVVGELMRYNELASEMFGELAPKNQSVREFLVSLGKDPVRIDKDAFEALMLGGNDWQLNYVKNDRELVIDFHVLGDSLADRLVVASAVDLSEIRRAERLRSELIEYLSHDLRSPLISSLYLVSQERESMQDQIRKKPFLQVEKNINKTLSMIDDLLGLTRAENLQVDQLQPVFFENIVESTIDQLLPQARQKDMDIVVHDIDEDVWITADSSLLERAFVNVVGNAIKYSPEGTRVDIITSLKGGDMLSTKVVDQGVGIPAERIDKLFNRFHRDPSIQMQFKGTGLGLALVATVIRQHGGSVHATSEENVGTTIEFLLPVMEVEYERKAAGEE